MTLAQPRTNPNPGAVTASATISSAYHVCLCCREIRPFPPPVATPQSRHTKHKPLFDDDRVILIATLQENTARVSFRLSRNYEVSATPCAESETAHAPSSGVAETLLHEPAGSEPSYGDLVMVVAG